MSSNIVVGTISKALDTYEFLWLIKLSDEILEKDGLLLSPTFSLFNVSWYFSMFPNSTDAPGNISLYLLKKEGQSEVNVHYSLEMILNGIQLKKWECEYAFRKDDTCGRAQYLHRSVVLDQWSKKTKDCSQLTIKIRMGDNVPPEEDALLEKRKEGMKILCQNIKDLLHLEKAHDLILRVKDREFKVHQIIMQCRCPVFKPMLDHDMLEKNRGVIEIPDCDPLAFEQFILYVYSGDFETLDESLMPGLYYIADKYDVACLKEMCREFLKKSLSPRNVCDVIKLALNHSDSSLLECGKKYYIDNVKKVLVTVEWQSFMTENPIQANELIIKTFNNYVPEEEGTKTTKS